MLEVRKKEGESPASLIFRFSKKIKQSGVLKEVKKRKFRGRPVSKRQIHVSAIHREKKRKEIEKLRKLGFL